LINCNLTSTVPISLQSSHLKTRILDGISISVNKFIVTMNEVINEYYKYLVSVAVQ
jgi:hypothetical protein